MLIRKGGDSDISQLYQLIKELAEYENEPNAVIATMEEYIQAWNQGVFEFLVATIDDQIIGIALYYLTFSTWKGRMLYLEDFVITAAYRKRGYGQAIFDAVIDEARNKKCALLKWQVLDWNTPALSFYEKNKAEIEKNWWNGKIVFKKT